ncbi:hypothetical protein NVP1090B_67 [Vibrio phage 1.090.B._10N.286.48.F1]|nr:hypothetical protein NVP1090B_67 [Vibrio phage 1.090.B._10N.286.48.F1]
MSDISDNDLERAVRIARMAAKCDCQEKGGDVNEHFATIICNDNERMAEQVSELKLALNLLHDAVLNVQLKGNKHIPSMRNRQAAMLGSRRLLEKLQSEG